MENRPWLEHYPKNVNSEIDISQFKNINSLFEQSIKKYRDKVAYENFGSKLTFDELDRYSNQFASYLSQELGLKKGDRIAIQLPNLLQYPIAAFGSLKAGLIIVNTNPLYTADEMEHQFEDAGVKAIVILENFAKKLEKIQPKVKIDHVIVTSVGEMLGFPKGPLINFALKYVKRQVPAYSLPGSLSFRDALKRGSSNFKAVDCSKEDIAFLQYTGGTTGVAKGAELTHENILSNMLQICEWMNPCLKKGEEQILTPLPLYHIFSLTVNCLGFLYYGGTNILITNPKDIPAFIKLMKKRRFTLMSGVNTLFNALLNNDDFADIDFSELKLSVAGGMALQESVSKRWLEVTKTPVIEGYGLTEASPVVSCNPIDGADRVGTIGIPLPSTDIRLVKEDGSLSDGQEAGELWVKGPQVMRGYWNRPDETKICLTDEGWLKTGDMAVDAGGGFFKIVDRKKNMILVSGFNVYPNEIEDVMAKHPGVAEVAAIGVPSERSGEAVKICVVKKDPNLTAKELVKFSRKYLTGYKTPDIVEFYDELPKTNVGKILHRKLKETHQEK